MMQSHDSEQKKFKLGVNILVDEAFEILLTEARDMISKNVSIDPRKNSTPKLSFTNSRNKNSNINFKTLVKEEHVEENEERVVFACSVNPFVLMDSGLKEDNVKFLDSLFKRKKSNLKQSLFEMINDLFLKLYPTRLNLAFNSIGTSFDKSLSKLAKHILDKKEEKEEVKEKDRDSSEEDNKNHYDSETEIDDNESEDEVKAEDPKEQKTKGITLKVQRSIPKNQANRKVWVLSTGDPTKLKIVQGDSKLIGPNLFNLINRSDKSTATERRLVSTMTQTDLDLDLSVADLRSSTSLSHVGQGATDPDSPNPEPPELSASQKQLKRKSSELDGPKSSACSEVQKSKRKVDHAVNKPKSSKLQDQQDARIVSIKSNVRLRPILSTPGLSQDQQSILTNAKAIYQDIPPELHSRVGHFKCSKCSKPFNQAEAVKRHESYHLTNRTFVCEWPKCVWIFADLNSLQRHEQSHVINKEQPYKCDWIECEMLLGFVTKQSLECHYRIKHRYQRPNYLALSDLDQMKQSSGSEVQPLNPIQIKQEVDDVQVETTLMQQHSNIPQFDVTEQEQDTKVNIRSLRNKLSSAFISK